MEKKTIERIVGTLPAFFNNAVDYLKDNFEENGKGILGEASGTAGVVIKLVGQPVIDNYFQKLADKKLADFGINVYLKAALEQANKSLGEMQDLLNDELDKHHVFDVTSQAIKANSLKFDPTDALLIFRPKYHPATVYVKEQYIEILRRLATSSEGIKKFTRHFNENIKNQVVAEFGNDYEAHLKEVEKYLFQENETDFLWDLVKLGRIGFQESENLIYEDTYGRWKKVSKFREVENEDSEENDDENPETSLKKIDDLIEEYFTEEPENHLKKILFIIADFGKGKSVFLKRYASRLAKSYLESREGTFPIYFNLRNFNNYSSEPKLGVISDYLLTEYNIKIDDEYFRSHKYVFLIDSLDESGELTKFNIDKVINSVQKIQNIEKSKIRTNKIIITSRPFDDGIAAHLTSHQPKIIKNDQGRDIEYFLSIYGFKKEQFNHWIAASLKTSTQLEKLNPTGFAKTVIDLIQSGGEADIYQELVEKKTLSKSELRRPIFAYMIYQLILNDIDFSALGKIGVYLSFLNLLTKEAKHIHDPSYKVDLCKEFEFRNILHAIASLWQHQRQSGKQGLLKKADICRSIAGTQISNNDNEVLTKFRNEGVTEIQFLSHSYFGEKDNVLHFNHQSFAEILLAEYYLKVFIKYGIDKQQKTEEARAKLVLGEPTSQTIEFFKGFLKLLREAAVNEANKEVIQKRKMLVGLMASLATDKHNQLYSNPIYYRWYEKITLEENQIEIPDKYLKDWCIQEEEIDRIIDLARSIIDSNTHFIHTKFETRQSLFNNELSFTSEKLDSHAPDIDKWLALLVGNKLYNDEDNNEYFNGTIQNYSNLFDLIKNWNYAFAVGGPEWGTKLFKGIAMDGNGVTLNGIRLSDFNFSHSNLDNLHIGQSWMDNCQFDNCIFNKCEFHSTQLISSSFANPSFKAKNIFFDCRIGANLPFPIKLAERVHGINIHYYTDGSRIYHIRRVIDKDRIKIILKPIWGIMKYALENGWFSIADIIGWFGFDSEESEKIFKEVILKLEPYEQPLDVIEANKSEL